MTDRNDAEAARWLAQLWQATTLPDPSEAAWAGVLAQIESSLAAQPSRPRLPQRRPRRFPGRLILGLGGVAAAAVLVLFAIVHAGGWFRGPKTELAVVIEPLPVAADDDVEIFSMDAADLAALIVGRPPYQGPLVLASVEDVFIDDTGHDVEVRVSGDFRVGPSSPPMLIMPLDGGAGR
jgi:hypothetical protein